MIVCISPSSQHFDETQNTLRYANRAKNIQTKSVRNVYNVDRHVKDYLKKIDEQMARINELTAQQKQFEELAFVKFRKAEVKRNEIAQDGVSRIRAAYEHSLSERNDRTSNTLRLRHTGRRIGAISGWIGSFDQVCETREDEEPSAALTAMRKTAQGILVELEGSRQHYYQRLAKNNWTRAIETALQDGVRQLQSLDGAIPESKEEMSLRQEVELLKNRADIDMHLAVLEQEKLGDAGLMQVMLTAHFETIAILNQITQMTEAEAIEAGRGVLGKLLQSCTEATGQVIKPDGGLQITHAVPPTKNGTPRKKKQVPLLGPSPIKNKIRASGLSAAPVSAIPPHLVPEMRPTSSPDMGPGSARGATASPRRRLKPGGTARSRVLFNNGTPKKKSPTKKRAVKWRDEDVDGGSLVEFQPTPKMTFDSSPPEGENVDPEASEPPKLSMGIDNENGNPDSSPLPSAPNFSTSEVRKSGNGRFATGFLQKAKTDGSSPGSMPPPSLTLGAFSSEDDSSPLREMEANRAPHSANRRTSTLTSHKRSKSELVSADDNSSTSGSEIDKESAKEIRSAMRSQHKRSSSLGFGGGNNTASRRSARESDLAHRRRSPTASNAGSPPQQEGQGIFSASHARRMVGSQRVEGEKSVLSPRTQPVSKTNGPISVRRSMFDLHGAGAGPRDSLNVVPGSARVASRCSNVGATGRAAWR